MSVIIVQSGQTKSAEYMLLIRNGVVENKILALEGFKPSKTFTVVCTDNEPGSPGIGWTYDGQTFSPPDPES